MPQIGVLAAYQQPSDRARTFLPKDVAAEMVRRMAAEKISAKMIRLFADDSSFTVLKAKHPDDRNYVPAHLPPVEIERCKYIPPQNSATQSMAMVRESWDWSKDALPEWVMQPPAVPLYA